MCGFAACKSLLGPGEVRFDDGSRVILHEQGVGSVPWVVALNLLHQLEASTQVTAVKIQQTPACMASILFHAWRLQGMVMDEASHASAL